jgi:hypothetical protein
VWQQKDPNVNFTSDSVSSTMQTQPGTKLDEGVALLESNDRLDDDFCFRVRQRIFDEIAYFVCQLSVFRPDNLPKGCPRVGFVGGVANRITNSKVNMNTRFS